MSYIDPRLEQGFSDKEIQLLRNIRTGGDNNQKGTNYENFFAASMILNFASSHSRLDQIIIESQQIGFVDDLSITDLTSSSKHNYQCKNSINSSARWSSNHENRFNLQQRFDQIMFNKLKSHQILLVPCKSISDQNNQLIKKGLSTNYSCEHFNDYPNINSLITEHDPTKVNLKKICGSDDINTHDTAIRLLLSAYQYTNSSNIQDIVNQAIKDSKPNLFVYFQATILDPPSILFELINRFEGLSLELGKNFVLLKYNGFVLRLDNRTILPTSIEQEVDISKVFSTIMSCSMQESQSTTEETLI